MSWPWSKRHSKGKLHITQPDATGPREISGPTDFKHEWHVGFDENTGGFVGLPPAWSMWLQNSHIR